MRDFLNGIFDRLFMYLPDCIQQTPPYDLVDVFDRLLRRYRATSSNLEEEPIYLTLKRL